MSRDQPAKGHIGTVGEDHEFVVPEKSVKTAGDMCLWEKSEAYFEYLGFLFALNEAVQGKPNSTTCLSSPMVQKINELLNHVDKLIDETPPIKQPQRFGNQAFRIWHGKLSNVSMNTLPNGLVY